MKKIISVIIFLYSFDCFAMYLTGKARKMAVMKQEMTERAQYYQLVSYQNGKKCDDGPLIYLEMALQMESFKNMYENIKILPGDSGYPEIELPDCDIETVRNFAACLNIHDEIQSFFINRFSTDELIKIYNIVDVVQVASLEKKLLKALTLGNNKFDDISQLRSLNMDLQKKMASYLIAQKKYDVALLKPYCEHIRKISCVIEQQGLVSQLAEGNTIKNICYYNEKTKVMLSTIKNGEEDSIHQICIESCHGYLRKGLFLDFIYNKFFNKKTDVVGVSKYNIKKLEYVSANDDETLFICEYWDNLDHRKKIVIDRINNCVIDEYEDYCFVYNYGGLYVSEKNDIYILKIIKHQKNPEKNRLLSDENTIDGSIVTFASNRKGYHAFAKYNEQIDLSYVYCIDQA
jgi:hypothetical protein